MYTIGKLILFTVRKLNPPKPQIKSQIRDVIYNGNRVMKNNLIKNFVFLDNKDNYTGNINYIDNWSFVNNNNEI